MFLIDENEIYDYYSKLSGPTNEHVVTEPTQKLVLIEEFITLFISSGYGFTLSFGDTILAHSEYLKSEHWTLQEKSEWMTRYINAHRTMLSSIGVDVNYELLRWSKKLKMVKRISISDWGHLFPYKIPRQEQIDAINEILNAFYIDDKRFVIAELGTGIGKSAIALTVSRYIALHKTNENLKSSYIVTSQKLLQDQYASEWGGGALIDLRASSNFKCSWDGAETCAETSRIIRSLGKSAAAQVTCDSKDEPCPFKIRKAEFLKSEISTTNYAYLLNESTYAGSITTREVLILDEAHGIEEVVKRWSTITIPRSFALELGVKTWPAVGDRASVDSWIQHEYKPALAILIASTLSSIQKNLIKRGGILTPTLKKYASRNEILDKHMCSVNRYLNEIAGRKEEYLHMIEERTNVDFLHIKPINVTPQSASSLYSLGNKVLLLSATILDLGVFLRSAGIPQNSAYHFFSIPTPFPAQNYGITYMPVGKMSRASSSVVSPRMVEVIKKILKAHPNEKGIIHTASYEITKLLQGIGDKRLLIQRSADDREGMIEKHKTSRKPTILVSPSMIEGVDLKDDLGRLQIICKIPYPYIGDPVIAEKMKADQRWYIWMTVKSIVQSVGRCVRNESDWTKTYILDECFSDIIQRYGEMLPKHFHAMDVLPTLLYILMSVLFNRLTKILNESLEVIRDNMIESFINDLDQVNSDDYDVEIEKSICEKYDIIITPELSDMMSYYVSNHHRSIDKFVLKRYLYDHYTDLDTTGEVSREMGLYDTIYNEIEFFFFEEFNDKKTYNIINMNDIAKLSDKIIPVLIKKFNNKFRNVLDTTPITARDIMCLLIYFVNEYGPSKFEMSDKPYLNGIRLSPLYSTDQQWYYVGKTTVLPEIIWKIISNMQIE